MDSWENWYVWWSSICECLTRINKNKDVLHTISPSLIELYVHLGMVSLECGTWYPTRTRTQLKGGGDCGLQTYVQIQANNLKVQNLVLESYTKTVSVPRGSKSNPKHTKLVENINQLLKPMYTYMLSTFKCNIWSSNTALRPFRFREDQIPAQKTNHLNLATN